MARRKRKTKNQQSKHVYQFSDIVFSSGWRTEDYRLAEKQRALDRRSRSADNASGFSQLIALITDKSIFNICTLTDYIIKNKSDSLPDLTHFYHNVSLYLRSRADRASLALESANKTYTDLKKTAISENAAYTNLIESLFTFIDTAFCSSEQLESLEGFKQEFKEMQLNSNVSQFPDFKDLV